MNTTLTGFWATIFRDALNRGDYETAVWAETKWNYYNTLSKIYE